MISLGIDTSCDDTSVAVLCEDSIEANLVSSHLVHTQYGGVVPEFASREHTKLLYPLFKLALDSAGITLEKIDLISVAAGPGLLGSLLCGLSFSKGLAQASGTPFRAVNHLEGHVYSVLLSNPELKPPFLVLVVSGGHTELLSVEAEFAYQGLGATLDDACGEALDKVGKLLGLGYPAGPQIERLARESNAPVKLPRPNPKGLDFSYSGLKTAARNYILRNPRTPVPDVAAGLQEAAFNHLADRVERAVDRCGISRVGVAGGVAVNSRLREILVKAGEEQGYELYFPSQELCTDNAAMIAAAGKARLQAFGPSELCAPAFDRGSLARTP